MSLYSCSKYTDVFYSKLQGNNLSNIQIKEQTFAGKGCRTSRVSSEASRFEAVMA